jgi:lysophospholipase L1-like esterase
MIIFRPIAARLKSCPDTKLVTTFMGVSFSQMLKAGLLGKLAARLKPRPFKAGVIERFSKGWIDMRRILLLVLVGFCALVVAAQTRVPITEKIEWTWTDRPETAVAGLPNVLLVGDSITRGYYPTTVKELSGVANVYLFATSASSGDPRLPGQLRDYFGMMGLSFAVIHFNNGMHGWGYTEKQYADGLPGMIAALRKGAPQAVLVWANTTPVLHDSTKGESTNARIEERNLLAAARMKSEGIAVDNQHGLMVKHPELHNGDVHFTEAGSALQAVQVAGAVREVLLKTGIRD